MKISKFFIAGAMALLAVPAVMADEAPKFMRSSIYTVLVNSDEQNTRLDKEAADVDAKAYKETLEASGLSSLAGIPKSVFPTLAIPEQFNDHNLQWRILDFDAITAGMTDAQAKEARPKGTGGNAFGKALLGSATGSSSIARYEKVDDYMHAAVNKFLADNKVADHMVAKWYGYDPQGTPQFNTGLIQERGLENASAAELAKANANEEFKAMLSSQGFELLNNTFVVATNLRFRNNKVLAKEISDIAAATAQAAGSKMGGFAPLAGMGAKLVTEKLVNAIMKDLYSVTAVTNLYKLDWNDDVDAQLADSVLYNENATLQTLLDQGVCKLTYVGQTKARAGVKKDKTKTYDQLASNATARAIDKALAKLQVENEVFRTIVPVSKSDNGMIYAKIGSKEGVMEGDEYEILEQQLDPKTNRYKYKKVGSAKAEKGSIWFNTTGADELIANAEEKEQAAMKEAQDLGYTCFKSGKKGDYSGYYLRLAKKKGKIAD